MSQRPAPEWYVTGSGNGNGEAVTLSGGGGGSGATFTIVISGGNTIGDECANRIAKLPDLERERNEAREDLKITQEAWLKAKIERVEALRERDKAMKLFESGKCACASLNEASTNEQINIAIKVNDLESEIRGIEILRAEAREQNTKLRDIAERLIAAGVGRMKIDDWRTLRAELNQLKEGAK
jgi:hypothetical protein